MDKNQPFEDQTNKFWGDYFCGCGLPEEAAKAFLEIMEIFDKKHFEHQTTHFVNFEKFQAYCKKYNDGLGYLILYWMTGMGLLEHGGSVGGSWLTPFGEHIRMQVLTCPADRYPWDE